jgi:hypothetical protein
MKLRLPRNRFPRARDLSGRLDGGGNDGFILLDLGKRRQLTRPSVAAKDKDFFTRAGFVKQFGKVLLGVMQLVCGPTHLFRRLIAGRNARSTR